MNVEKAPRVQVEIRFCHNAIHNNLLIDSLYVRISESTHLANSRFSQRCVKMNLSDVAEGRLGEQV
ncbi:hypothetical protein D3C85_1837250 [compost metagenome]